MIFIFISSILAVSMAQRPSFAGSGVIGVPKLASRFQNTGDDASSTTRADIGNRFGTDSAAPTSRIPTDARGDVALVDRLNSWPRENRPFWLLNADHIERYRNPNGGGPTDTINFIQDSIGNRQGTVDISGQKTNDDNSQRSLQFTQNRGSFGQDQEPEQNYFTVLSNNRLKTYIYDPFSDSWRAQSP